MTTDPGRHSVRARPAPRANERATGEGRDAPSAERQAANPEIERAVASYWRARAESKSEREPEASQLPGTTVDLGAGARPAASGDQRGSRDELAASSEVSAFDALGSDGLAAYADLSFATRPVILPVGAAKATFVYQHRFAEPFADLTARLALRPLPGVGSVTYVYALAALLLATGVLGLAALYRMVSVVVSFAERRQNFVAAVSHELKTPLTAIRMYGEMLRDGMVVPRQNSIRAIQAASAHW